MQRTNFVLDGNIVSQLRAEVEEMFSISEVKVPEGGPPGSIAFYGKLLAQDADGAFDLIAQRWARHNYTPMLTRDGLEQILRAQVGVIRPKRSDPRINILLFLVTLATVMIMNALNEGVDLARNPLGIASGLPFTIAFLAILGTHEFGHYFAARHHKVAVTLPYFIPFPTIWGTLGAFIQLRSPTVNRKQLFDVGVAGPLAGLVIALPVLVIGLFLSKIQPLPAGGYIMEGNSILYALLKRLIFGRMLPSADGFDVFLHPLAWAGWSGLMVTALNLLPVGQLDGGHIMFSLFGKFTRIIGIGFICLTAILGIFWQGWLIWVIFLLFLIGPGHPPPLNDLSPLDGKRRILGYLAIFIFLLIFTPIPINIVPPA